MRSSKEINAKINIVSMIERIARGYQEISQETMYKIRKMTLENRIFIEELLNVFWEAKNAYVIEKGRQTKTEGLFEPQKEKVAVFLSANSKFYGQLILEIWQKVESYLTKVKADLIVIGQIGEYLVINSEFAKNYSHYYFHLDDEKPDEINIKQIINFIKNYKDIKIFHGKFKTILNQEVAISDISLRLPEDKPKEQFACLFEPNLAAVLNFFQQELLIAFFTQALLEHRLSRHATRAVAMHYVQKRAQRKKLELEHQARKLKWQKLNKQHLEVIISSKKWR